MRSPGIIDRDPIIRVVSSLTTVYFQETIPCCQRTMHFRCRLWPLAIFPYHPQLDTEEWMDAYGDPDWKYHIASAKIWSVMAVYLLESPCLWRASQITQQP